MNDPSGPLAERLAELTRAYARSGASPATSGNYSVRLDDGDVLITASGIDKAAARAEDLLRLSAAGEPRSAGQPSAETALHLALYRRDPEIRAVLHTHCADAVLLGRLRSEADVLDLAGYELLKAFPGYATHEAVLRLPMVDNDQDMDRLSARADAVLDGLGAPAWGYVIRDHGLYAWGRCLEEAARHVEAFDYLLALEARLAQHPAWRP